jgi:hypothetical protein
LTRSWFFTLSPFDVFQSFFSHDDAHTVAQFMLYWLSVMI